VKPENENDKDVEVREPTKDVGFGEIFAQSDSGNLYLEIPDGKMLIYKRFAAVAHSSAEESSKPKTIGASLFGVEDEPIIARYFRFEAV